MEVTTKAALTPIRGFRKRGTTRKVWDENCRRRPGGLRECVRRDQTSYGHRTIRARKHQERVHTCRMPPIKLIAVSTALFGTMTATINSGP